MALQTLSGGLIVPMLWGRSGTTAFNAVLLDADGEKYAVICQAPKTGTIDRIALRTGTVTTGATVTCTIEGVSAANGDPDGTPIGTGTVAIADGDDNAWKECTLSSTASVTRGNLMAVVIAVPAGANLNIAPTGSMVDWVLGWAFPYADHYTTAWSKLGGDVPTVVVRYNDATYPNIGTMPASALANTAWNSASTPDERGLKFTLPFPARLTGVISYSDFNADATIKVYDSDGSTVLTSLAVDTNQQFNTSTGPRRFTLPATVSLSKDVAYRVTIVPGASNVAHTELTVDSAALLDALDGGQAFHLTTRTDAGAWTDTTTQRPFLHLVLDQFDDGVGGSGGGIRLAGHGGLAA